MRAALTLILLALAPAALAAAAGPGGAPEPKALVLRASDVPRGFRLASARRYSTAAQMAKGNETVTAARYRSWGFVGAYRVEFAARDADHAATGIGVIGSTASVYRTPAGARAALADLRRTCRRAPLRTLPTGGALGGHAVLCSIAQVSEGVTLQAYLVAWARGELGGEVVVTGLAGVIAPSRALELAQRQDRYLVPAVPV